MTLDQLEADVGLEAALFTGIPVEQSPQRSPHWLRGVGQRDEHSQDAALTWVDVAEQHDRAIDNGHATAIPAKDVFRRIRALLQ